MSGFGYKIHLGRMKACTGSFFSDSYAVEDVDSSGFNDRVEGCRNKCSENAECMFFVLRGEAQNRCALYKTCEGIQTIDDAVVTFSRQTTGR